MVVYFMGYFTRIKIPHGWRFHEILTPQSKYLFRIRFATAKPCFALQFLPPTSGRNCAATRATPSEVLGWSRANSANAYWTLHTITLAHTILGASGHLRSYKTSSVLRMKAYSVMNAKVCTFLSCHCKICEEYFSAICTFSCSMNESFQNESTCWAESRKPDCGVANSMEEQQCQSCDWILFHFGSASPEFLG